jgi:hypothetical protein
LIQVIILELFFQMSIGKPYLAKGGRFDINYNAISVTTVNKGTRYPKSVLKFKNEKYKRNSTQKPVLYNY